jgi:hypothetical protein
MTACSDSGGSEPNRSGARTTSISVLGKIGSLSAARGFGFCGGFFGLREPAAGRRFVPDAALPGSLFVAAGASQMMLQGRYSQFMNVATIRALWREVEAARARQFEDAVKWFNIADACAVWRDRRARWNLDAVLRVIIPASRGYAAEPTLEALFEMETLMLSRAPPGQSRALFDGLWKRWCIRACKSDTPWE